MFVKFDPHDVEPLYRKFIWPLVMLSIILLVGTVGYWFFGEGQATLFDGLYMTIITVSTIGYGEVFDISNNLPARIFTIAIAFLGVGVVAYVTSQVTAALVGGQFMESYRRKKMIKAVEQMEDHYIVCGVGTVGINVVHELHRHEQPCVLVEKSEDSVDNALEHFNEQLFILGDATEDEVLIQAGIHKAAGLFAATEHDNHNLVICFTARQINPSLKIVANCREAKNEGKIRKAGADAVVSPAYMGGMRMASEMVNPSAISLMESVLQRKLLVEDLLIPDSLIGRPLSELNLVNYPQTILIGIKSKGDWQYNPPKNHISKVGDHIVILTTEAEKSKLKDDLDNMG